MFADGSPGVRCIWWLLQCSHLMVPLCLVVCPVGARLIAVCRAALCPAVLLHALLPVSGSFFFCWHAHCFWCAAPPRPPPREKPKWCKKKKGGGGAWLAH